MTEKERKLAVRRAWYARTKDDPTFKAKRRARGRKSQAGVRARLRERPESWLKLALSQAKYRASKSGLPFTITADDVEIPNECPVLGTPFDIHCKRTRPSLDRFRPELGYVRGNVRIISQWANTLKNDCTDPAVFERLAAYVRSRPS